MWGKKCSESNLDFQSWHTSVIICWYWKRNCNLPPFDPCVRPCKRRQGMSRNLLHPLHPPVEPQWLSAMYMWTLATCQMLKWGHGALSPRTSLFHVDLMFPQLFGRLYLLKSMQNGRVSMPIAAKAPAGLAAGMVPVEPQKPNWKQQVGALTPNTWSCKIWTNISESKLAVGNHSLSSFHIKYVWANYLCKGKGMFFRLPCLITGLLSQRRMQITNEIANNIWKAGHSQRLTE